MSISAMEALSVQTRFLTMSLKVTECQDIMETNGDNSKYQGLRCKEDQHLIFLQGQSLEAEMV
jgi:hypothetical protein